MNNENDPIIAQLHVLRASFAEQLPEKIQEIETCLGELRVGDAAPDALKTLHFLIHKLTGSGATFGFSALSTAARALESTLMAIINGKAKLTAVHLKSLSEDAALVKHAAMFPDAEKDTAHTPIIPIQSGPITQSIFMVEDDELFAKDVALKIGPSGYTVRCFSNLTSFREAIKDAQPAAIIMDMMLPDGNGADAIADLRETNNLSLPVIFLSSHGDLSVRLKAVQCGGYAYLTKPLDINALVDTLDKATLQQKVKPYRVLIVEDSQALAMLYSHTLKAAGMITETVMDPMNIMATLASFVPELILMDVYMPGCTGLELATVLRQQEKYVSVPIVFLSGETDLNKQLGAMQLGGDDFLVKPIQPDHLVLAVSNRVSRYRILRSFMKRDSLTGLYNHTTTKEYLEYAMAVAKRRGTSLVFAMIDLDHFKSVNDTYGHATGDRVIKSLTRLLQQRLRKTDILGRYGGEEFAVVLIDTDMENACKVMENIRRDFSQIRQEGNGVGFTSTFSCGISAFPAYDSAVALNDAADKAMYDAKHRGRNRIAIANG